MEGGGTRGGGESTFPLKPRRNVGGFPEIRPRPPAGRPPLTWASSPGNARRGVGAHLGGRGQVLFRLPPAASRSGKGEGGCWKPTNLLSALGRSDPNPHDSVSLSANKHGKFFYTLDDDPPTHTHTKCHVAQASLNFSAILLSWSFLLRLSGPPCHQPPSSLAWQPLLTLFCIMSPKPIPCAIPGSNDLIWKGDSPTL